MERRYSSGGSRQTKAMNPFSDDINAEQYDAARPYFHPLVFERLVRVFGSRFVAALDIACGTGQSTEALASVSTFVVGLDASAQMLHGARRRGVIPYVQGRAERLPFPDNAFDIITVGLGLHWFERDAFLSEASRVLRPGAWLLVYDSGFCGRMTENPAFGDWVKRYCERFPAPERDDQPTPQEVLDRFGLTAVVSDRFVHDEVYDLEQLVRYLQTQSNILFALKTKQETPEEVSAWLRGTLRPLFPGERATFEYEGWSLLFQKGWLAALQPTAADVMSR
jgi:ubiquinone/menaquinone biosynthesis C-methylase UbiE